MKSQQKDEPQSNKKLLFGLVLFDSKEKSQIEQAIGSILKINYPADKLKIILCSYLSAEKSLNNYVHHANVLLEKFRHTRLLMNHQLEKEQDVDHNAFSICSHANYLVKMNHDEKIQPDFFNRVCDSYHKPRISKTGNRSYEVDEASKNIDLIISQGDVTAIPRRMVSKNYLYFNSYDKMSQYLIDQSDSSNYLRLNEK
jgi:hypothetical protein